MTPARVENLFNNKHRTNSHGVLRFSRFLSPFPQKFPSIQAISPFFNFFVKS